MRSRIDALDGHYIICAYGRVGRSAAEELIRQGQQVVVIETLEDLEPRLAEDGSPTSSGTRPRTTSSSWPASTGPRP